MKQDMLLHEFVPYLELHRNLSEQEHTAADMLEAEAPLAPEQTAYFNAVLSHVDACREKLNSGQTRRSLQTLTRSCRTTKPMWRKKSRRKPQQRA